MTLLSSPRRLIVALALLIPMAAIAADAPRQLLIYCGITMVRPITEIARKFEQSEGVRILVSQGGSEDLYQSAKKSGVGDLYLPGEPSYRTLHLAEGLLGEFRTIGFNQLGIVVLKGNPKNLRADVRELLRKDLAVLIGNVESGSVGQESKVVLDAVGIYPKVIVRATFLAPDSRAINNALKRGEADAALNWRATAYFPDNATHLDLIDLDPKLAKPQALLLNLLTFSKEPELARRFMARVMSDEGQATFRRHGFYDATMRVGN